MVNGKCWMLINNSSIRSDADKICKTYNGATLVSIRNTDENQALTDFIKNENINTLWTGLYCFGETNITACIWDIQAGSAANYSSFKVGYPDADYGRCVFYIGNGTDIGQWENEECGETMPFVCELPPTVHAIGGFASSKDYMIWMDGSPTDYNNIQFSYAGSCVIMAAGTTDTGYWYTRPYLSTSPSAFEKTTEMSSKSETTTEIEDSTTTTSVTPPDLSTTVDPRNQTCTNHFTLINGKCWRMFNLTHSRTSADGICFLHNGATLVSIKRANENRALVDFVKNEHLDTVWTGLLCNNGTNITSCIWDIQAGTAARYSNFEAGYPDVTYGGCVYFTASGKAIGQWGSAQCSQSMAFVCELPPTVFDETCIFNYNENCYTRFDNYWSFSGAQRECESRCSNLVSIHSANEMRFIQTIYSDVQSAFIRIGGIAMSQDFLIWTDGSPGDFENIQYFQPGSCIIMATGTSKSGYWYTHPCDQGYVYLCEQPAGVHC
ncbi:hypothetical protein GCK72_019824 [Caenorhabditis remanei]|uniref:C-type lectin domain-containing protein n=1 Tax=Caenorhabditis remanei TaxID=31234 RepID=A0A6A5GDR2_CAERE|nr:hypothetical protein GCK72_019824 [Caenorhabditis remanei]KAF1753268.1 hypothetical protein GCK72_019824 [Caenorhabditis remanei]